MGGALGPPVPGARPAAWPFNELPDHLAHCGLAGSLLAVVLGPSHQRTGRAGTLLSLEVPSASLVELEGGKRAHVAPFGEKICRNQLRFSAEVCMAPREVTPCIGSHRIRTRALPPKSLTHPVIPEEALEVRPWSVPVNNSLFSELPRVGAGSLDSFSGAG